MTPTTRPHGIAALPFARPSATLLARSLMVAGLVPASAVCSLAMAAGPGKPASAEAASIAELAKKLDALAAQNKALQDKVDKLEAAQAQQGHQQAAQFQQQLAQQAATVQQQGAQVQNQALAIEQVQKDSRAAGWAAGTTVSSYGEIGYSHPTQSAADTSVDVQRAVIGIQHRFDDKTKMAAEFEWEHAITSSDDSGEAEVEQLWIEHEFQPGLRGRAGLFLMPVGLINQNHEPTAYYGVFRPDVDTKIIPSTWREVGIGLSGETAAGLTWDLALTTAPNLSKWDPASTEARDRGPLQSIHGEGQFAAARTGGLVGALNWRGVPGLLVGGSLVYASIGQGQRDFLGNGAKLAMIDLHARYQIAGWDFAGEFVHASISHTDALNASYAASEIEGGPTFVPNRFYGGYVQAAYKLWEQGSYALKPFARYEVLNTAAGYGSLPAAADGIKAPDERIWTVGASLLVGEGVVLKADYRGYKQNKQPDPVDHFNLGNSLNLGVGFSF